jgi:cytochrome d oxidase, subunit II (cydB)
VIGSLEGHRIVAGANPFAPSNPLLKSVEVARGAWLDNYRALPALWLAPVGTVLMALTTWGLLTGRRHGAAFISSCLVQAGTILTAGFALFPFLLPSSTQPDHGLTIWDASSSMRTLSIMLVAVIVFLPIVLAYTAWVFRVLKGRITLEHIRRIAGLH